MFLFVLPRAAYVNQYRRARRQPLVCNLSADAFSRRRQVRPPCETAQAVFQKAGNVIEPDAAEARRRLMLAARIGDDDDRIVVVENRAGPGRILATQADVDASGKMRGREIVRVARVQNLAA